MVGFLKKYILLFQIYKKTYFESQNLINCALFICAIHLKSNLFRSFKKTIFFKKNLKRKAGQYVTYTSFLYLLNFIRNYLMEIVCNKMNDRHIM